MAALSPVSLPRITEIRRLGRMDETEESQLRNDRNFIPETRHSIGENP